MANVVYKSMYKNELAQAAGVSTVTFWSWLRKEKLELEALGVSPCQKILPPSAVKYLCEKYCISLDD